MGRPNYPENEYLMKAVMRVLVTAGDAITPLTGNVIQQLGAQLQRVCKNPSNPMFNHYLFECLSALIKFVTAGNPGAATIDQFEQMLFPPFQMVLQHNIVEFMPYVFQIFAQMLEMRRGVGISQNYMQLLPRRSTRNSGPARPTAPRWLAC